MNLDTRSNRKPRGGGLGALVLGLLATACTSFLLAGVPAAAQTSLLDQAAAKIETRHEVKVETELGSFVIRLLPEVAPAHVKHFLETAEQGGFDGTTFHRIIPGGIIQGGDPLTKDPANAERYGTGGLGLLKAEFSSRPFLRGTVAAARRPSSVNSGGSQFFICVREQPSLEGQYTIFGEVASGMEIVDQISMTPVVGDRPQKRVEMKVTLRESAPSGDR